MLPWLHERVLSLRYKYEVHCFSYLTSGCSPQTFPIFRATPHFICQHHVVLQSGHPSKYQKCPSLLNCDDLTWTGIAQLWRTLTERMFALYTYFTQYWTDRIDTKLHCSCFETHVLCLVEDTERILSSEEILQCDNAQRGVHVAGISKFFTVQTIRYCFQGCRRKTWWKGLKTNNR